MPLQHNTSRLQVGFYIGIHIARACPFVDHMDGRLVDLTRMNTRAPFVLEGSFGVGERCLYYLFKR